MDLLLVPCYWKGLQVICIKGAHRLSFDYDGKSRVYLGGWKIIKGKWALGKAGCMAFPKCQLFDYQSVEQM